VQFLVVNLGRPIVIAGVLLLHDCAEVRELIELSFGLVSWVGQGTYVLAGVDVLQREERWVREVSRIFPIRFNGALLAETY